MTDISTPKIKLNINKINSPIYRWLAVKQILTTIYRFNNTTLAQYLI